MLGSEYILSAARAQGVSCCFMVPGGLNDAFMPPMTGTEALRTVVAAFEGGAAFMADGYARATGGLGLCFGIGGPGVLNMATALASAKADRSPVLAISGEVPTSLEGLGGFQDASGAALDDIAALTSLTGLSESVASPAVLPHHLRQAITHALVARKPVHLSVPVDVQKAEIQEPWAPVPEALTALRPLDENALDAAVTLLAGARPMQNIVLLAGPGVELSAASADLVAVAERFELPVATTLAGKGAFPEDHPLALGVFGYGGSRWATEAILSAEVEVLIVLGTALNQRDTLHWDRAMLPSRALVHVHADPLAMGGTWPAEVPLVGDPGVVLQRLNMLDGKAARALDAGRATRRHFLAAVRAGGPQRYAEAETHSDAVPMHPARVVAELRAALPREGALAVDAGAHRAFFAEYWTAYGPRTHFSLTNLGPMGGGVALGIGAKLARPEVPLLIATGDGCMLMHGMELHTAARERAAVIVAVMDNRSYGNIWYRARTMGPGAETLTDIPGIDWVGFARSVGAEGEAVARPEQIRAAMERALAADGPYLLDLRIDKTCPTPITPWRRAVKEWEDDH